MNTLNTVRGNDPHTATRVPLPPVDGPELGHLPNGYHAELETSILLHANPELVRDGYQAADWVADNRRHLLTTGMGEYTRSGVIGRPSLASAEKGKAVLASLADSFASVLEILRRG
jgi:creatinine amidohydrolase